MTRSISSRFSPYRGNGTLAGRDLRRGGIGDAGHQRRDRRADVAPRFRVVRNPSRHQVPADIGEAETEGAERVRQFGDPPGRKLRHHHRDFEHQRPQPHGVLECRHVERTIIALKSEQVEGGEVTRRVVEEHVLRTRIGGVDPPALRTGVPLIDGRIELKAGVGAGPGGGRDLVPQRAGGDALGDFTVRPPDQRPVLVGQHPLKESVGDPDTVVGVLPGNGKVGFGIPVGIEHREGHVRIALAGKGDHPLNVIFRDHRLAACGDRLLQGEIALWIERRLRIARFIAVRQCPRGMRS
jgi:hypothetical protein